VRIVACNNAVMLGVLAHEVGHHVERDALINEPWSKRDRELRADRYAGAALAALGVTQDHFARVLWAISRHHSGGSPFEYPHPRERIAAIDGAYHATLYSIASAYHASQGYVFVA
jgi:Zn-dependent protease with chaperone function